MHSVVTTVCCDNYNYPDYTRHANSHALMDYRGRDTLHKTRAFDHDLEFTTVSSSVKTKPYALLDVLRT